MAKPIHVSAFEHFYNSCESHLEAAIAFGLFMESEHKWASRQATWPTEKKYAAYHEIYLTPHEAEGYRENARRVLLEYSNNLVESEQAQFLEAAVQQYRTEAGRGHSAFRKWGVVEALVGALLWTMILIVVSIIAVRFGIDLLEIYQKAAGTHH